MTGEVFAIAAATAFAVFALVRAVHGGRSRLRELDAAARRLRVEMLRSVAENSVFLAPGLGRRVQAAIIRAEPEKYATTTSTQQRPEVRNVPGAEVRKFMEELRKILEEARDSFARAQSGSDPLEGEVSPSKKSGPPASPLNEGS